MVNLKHQVQKRGFTVAHIKTDSIKIPDATPEIIQFVMDYGAAYGYTFEHEDTYEKMCLVNDAVYIAKYKEAHKDKKTGEDIWWTATGTQFAVPYVFKTLFSKEPIVFEDMCEAKSVTTALYLDMNESLPDVSVPEKVKEIRQKNFAKCSGKERTLFLDWQNITDEELDERIAEGHDYKFVGKVGNFCPIKPGCGGGELVREATDKDGNVKKLDLATGLGSSRFIDDAIDENTEYVYIPGAFTNSVIQDINLMKLRKVKFILKNPTKIFLSAMDWGLWRKKGFRVNVLKNIEIAAVTVNPWAPAGYTFDSETLREAMQEALPDIPVIDVRV
jgi:hypothetical protein